MNIENLFVNTLKDLEVKIGSNDPYEILMATALLRKLLIDENPLVDQVNKSPRLRIGFDVNDRLVPTNVSMWFIQDGFDPETSVPHLSKPINMNKDNMLKRPVMLINGVVITVLDLIKFQSHVQGAVHSGDPRSDKEKVLKNAEETFTVGGMPGGLRSIKAIGRVVLKGLEPLKQEVLRAQG